MPLHGAHQGDNASRRPGRRGGLLRGARCDEDVVEEAFAAVRVPGRLEVIGRHPLVVVDGAHNVAGMLVLARSLVEEFAVDGEAHRRGRACSSGRDPVAMLEALRAAGVRSVVACAPDSPPRPARRGGGRGGSRAGHGGHGGRHARPMRSAWPSGRAGPDDRVVVCGSLYVVAEARRLLVHDAA